MLKRRICLVMAGAGTLGLWMAPTSALAAPPTAAMGQAEDSLLIQVQDVPPEAEDQDGDKKKKKRDRDGRGGGDRGGGGGGGDRGGGGGGGGAERGGGGGGGGGEALQAPQGAPPEAQPRAIQSEDDGGRKERKREKQRQKAQEEQERAKQLRPAIEDRSGPTERAGPTERFKQRDPAEMQKTLEDAAERQRRQREKEADQKQKRQEKQERAVEELRRPDEEQKADPSKALRDRDEALQEKLREKRRDKQEAVQEKPEQPEDDASKGDRRRFGRGGDDKNRQLDGELPRQDATGDDDRKKRFGRGEDDGQKRFGRGDGRDGSEGRDGPRRDEARGENDRDWKDRRKERRVERRFDELKQLRKERKEGNRIVIEEPDNRIIVKDRGRTIIKHDERERFRRGARDVREQRRPDGGRLTIFVGPGGAQIVTEYDQYNRMLRRMRRFGGREYVLIDNRQFYRGAPPGPGGYYVDLPPPRIGIPRDDYIVDYEDASEEDLYDALTAGPVEPLERGYALEEIQQSYSLRERMRSVDLDTINFAFGSWEVSEEYYGTLERLAEVINRIVQQDPAEVYLIEGHTDAVGSEDDNLSLSDRRAESVAVILSENFGVPAENLVTQGYGEQFLKVPTEEPNRENRRVSVRRITPLMTSEAQVEQQ